MSYSPDEQAEPKTRHQLMLEVSPDKVTVSYSGPVPADVTDPVCDQLAGELCTLGVTEVPSRDELVERIRAAAAGAPIAQGIPLLQGRPPVPTEDGSLEWEGDFFQKGFLVDEKTGAMDFRQRSAQLSVAEGQLLAHLTPPREGEAGIDVFGKPIPVPRGRAFRIRTGPNVRCDEAMGCYYATVSGRIRWSGEILSVDPVFEIPGSVGLATGNIVHPGALVVSRDVESGSTVKAAGDVEVKGAIEAADVDCGGSLVVMGGLTGGEGHWVRAGGEVHARFVRDAEVEAGGDILVEKEAIQSILKTRGSFVMPRGRVIGGEVIALRGIEVRDAGSQAGIQTMLVVGENFARAAEMAALQKRIAELEVGQGRIRHALDISATRMTKLTPDQFRSMMALENKLVEADEEIRELRELLRSGTEVFAPGHPRIVIHGCLYPETLLRIGSERYSTSDAIRGPITALVSSGGVILIPSDLTL